VVENAPCAVQGYADLAAGLEKVSEAKGAVDEAKGQVLQVRMAAGGVAATAAALELRLCCLQA
jgi:hypothetical protein